MNHAHRVLFLCFAPIAVAACVAEPTDQVEDSTGAIGQLDACSKLTKKGLMQNLEDEREYCRREARVLASEMEDQGPSFPLKPTDRRWQRRVVIEYYSYADLDLQSATGFDVVLAARARQTQLLLNDVMEGYPSGYRVQWQMGVNVTTPNGVYNIRVGGSALATLRKGWGKEYECHEIVFSSKSVTCKVGMRETPIPL